MEVKRQLAVLVVDDETTARRLLLTILKRIGINDVEEAWDGAEALARLRARRFDVVISDWHMRPMSGFELLGHVRGDPLLADLPFIMVTAECAARPVAAAHGAGVSGYVVKPFQADVLLGLVRAACGID